MPFGGSGLSPGPFGSVKGPRLSPCRFGSLRFFFLLLTVLLDLSVAHVCHRAVWISHVCHHAVWISHVCHHANLVFGEVSFFRQQMFGPLRLSPDVFTFTFGTRDQSRLSLGIWAFYVCDQVFGLLKFGPLNVSHQNSRPFTFAFKPVDLSCLSSNQWTFHVCHQTSGPFLFVIKQMDLLCLSSNQWTFHVCH